MKSAREIRVGNVIKIDGELFLVLKSEFHKSTAGRRASTSETKMKLKNLATKQNRDITVEAASRVEDIRLDKRESQFLYRSEGYCHFMDQTTFEQFEISEEEMGENLNYLKGDMILHVMFYEERPVSVELPTVITYAIEYTEPGLRGDTTGRAMKPATMENGLQVSVPLFCKIGDMINVDSRSGEYIERCQQ